MLATLLRCLILGLAKFITGARAHGEFSFEQNSKPTLYYANHTSHGDFVLLWATLPAHIRQRTRPVAGADYWGKTPLRRFIIHQVFNGVLIARDGNTPGDNPLTPLFDALNQGDSLIFFPEGTRNLTDADLLPFKSGLFYLTQQHPSLILQPVWITNLNRAMPKGYPLPLPLLCTLNFGPRFCVAPKTNKAATIEFATTALTALQQDTPT